MSNLVKNLLIALGITVLLAIGYFLFFQEEDTEMFEEFDLPGTSFEIEQVLSDTQKIKSYDVEGHSRILTDKRFTSLVDRRIDIPEVDTGRDNPFAPVQ